MHISGVISQELQRMEDIYTSLRINNITLSKTESSKIVGSLRTLEKLVASGKVRMVKNNQSQAGRWNCNAEDVLRNVNYKEYNNKQ